MRDAGNKLAEALESLAKSVTDLAVVRAAYDFANAKETAKQSVGRLRTHCENAAKNFGIDLSDASSKYDSARAKVKEIEQQYEQALDELRENYAAECEENTASIAACQGAKAGYLETLKDAKKAKKMYLRKEAPDIADELEPYDDEIADLETQMLQACKEHDYDKVKELSEKCEKAEAKKTEIESKLEGDHKEKIEGYDAAIAGAKAGHESCVATMKGYKELAKQMKKEYEEQCNALEEQRTEALTKVEGNKFFDRLKGFFAKNAIGSANKVKKFEKDFLEPLGKQVSGFVKGVPDMIKTARENFEKGVNDVLDKGDKALDNFIERASNLSEKGLQVLKDVGTLGKGAVIGIGTVAGKVGDKALEAGKAVIGVGEKAVHATVEAGKAVGNATLNVGKAAVGATVEAGKAVIGVGEKAVHATVEAGKAVGNATLNAGKAAVGATVEAGKAVYGAGKTAVGGVRDFMSNAYAFGKRGVTNGVTDLKVGVAYGLDCFATVLEQKAESNRNKAQKIRESMQKSVGDDLDN